MKKNVLGIKIDDVNLEEATKTVIGWLSKAGKHYIVTPNPELVVMAQKDLELKKIINQADLAIPDGVGLKRTTDIVCYTPGIDLMEELIKQANDYGFTIGFLGGEIGVAEEAANCLRKKYQKLKIVYADNGGKVDEQGKLLKSPKLLKMDILFVAFGQPKQEKWMYKNLSQIPVKVAMGVGGSLDFLSGKAPRAPKFLRSLGLEWLFRLIIQPWRIKRQLRLLEYIRLVMLS